MKVVVLAVADVARKTAAVIEEMLNQSPNLRVVRPGSPCDCLISYGARVVPGTFPVLNVMAGTLTKHQELSKLSVNDIRTPYMVTDINHADWGQLNFPLLARKKNHHGGRDIQPVLQPEEMEWKLAAGADFFTEYIPSLTEYRVWIYRQNILAVYEKVMQHPEQYTRIGRNRKNGFAFSYRENVSTQITSLAARAVHVLKLDFGAVDVLIAKNGGTYVLEVNSAPGAEDGTRYGIRRLVRSMVKWVERGCPNRSTTWRGVEPDAEQNAIDAVDAADAHLEG